MKPGTEVRYTGDRPALKGKTGTIIEEKKLFRDDGYVVGFYDYKLDKDMPFWVMKSNVESVNG